MATETVEIRQFTCLSDNFGVLIHVPATNATIAVDVPDAAAYQAILAETGWKLTDILITHHHHDHVGGLAELKGATSARAIGPALSAERIGSLDHTVSDGDQIRVGGLTFHAIATPGHTLDQISWWTPDAGIAHTGDTLFALGCGRIFEGDPVMMWASLAKLIRILPADTRIYCGHEYTLANARFAISVDPHNKVLADRIREIETLCDAGEATLPTTMAAELATNPFLRPADPGIRRHLDMDDAEDADVFAEIRRRKDTF